MKHQRTKHIDIKYHFIREEICNGYVNVVYIPTDKNVADTFTKLANNIKYFPFHLKCFNLLTMINAKTGQFVPAAQYLLQPFDSSHIEYFNAKPRALQDKSIPDTTISLKVAKKHVETQEIKDRIVKESLEALTLYLAANATSLSFPELFVPIGVVLRKFKKNIGNSNYRKMV